NVLFATALPPHTPTRGKNCAICYNESGNFFSQAIWSARQNHVGRLTIRPSLFVSLRLSSFASRRSAMPFPRLASDASGASWSWGSCNARFDHHCLDCLRRSLLLRHDRIELISPLQ